jgi:hypothetical protein
MNLLLNPKKLTLSIIALLVFPAIANSAIVTITANTNWSAITTGCSGGVPCAGDTVIVKNGARLSVNINNAVCGSLQLGDPNAPSAGNGRLRLSAANRALVVNGIITLGNSTTTGSIDMSLGGTLTCNGFNAVNIGTFNPGTGTIVLNATNTLPSDPLMDTFNNLIINGGTTSLSQDTTVNGNMTIAASGTLDASAGNYRIDMLGSWYNLGGTFVERAGRVNFGTGAAPQSINGETFYNLGMVGATDTSLTGETTVTNRLFLLIGDLILGNNDLIIGVPGTGGLVAGSPASYVQITGTGVMKRFCSITAGTLEFPIGDSANFSRINIILSSITTTLGGADYITASVTNAMHPQLNGFVDYIQRYWTVNAVGFTAMNYRAQYYYADADIVTTEANLVQRTWNGSAWSSSGSITLASNSVTTANTTVMPVNFDFTAASNGALLPIELLNFDAKVEGKSVKLSWSTASETNNDYFTIERSANAVDFETLTTVPGAGNSSQTSYYNTVDEKPLIGISYYRLKQTDFDGKHEYFGPTVVNYDPTDTTVKVTAFPNPLNGQDLFVALTGFTPNTEVLVAVRDMLGKELYTKTFTTADNGSATAKMDLYEKLAAGMYIITGASNGKMYTERLLVP